ncbi:DUF4352 domain-containing protein [Paenibacillus terrae]|uniref:DUF4352 domain-containing protein n=1 Tax=Paenibacillus terrae TaxID=159743 RepID=UPI00069625D5|nr:DUF4352 domain-containing protein [Paenibacillus terrae]
MFNKKVLLFTTAILAFGIIAAGCGAKATTTDSGKATGSTTQADTKAAATAEKEAAPKETKVGEAVKVGNLTVTASKVSAKTKIGENEYLQKTTEEKFIVINLAIKNGDKEARTLDSSMFKLIGTDGTEYEPMSDADMYINKPENMLFFAKINPGLTKKANVAFEVPKDSKGFKLQADSGLGFEAGESALIDIGK